ncbi:MAG: HD domain-containing phosphohydrolase [Elusimicrobiota bacterium]
MLKIYEKQLQEHMEKMSINETAGQAEDLFEWKRILSLILEYSTEISALHNVESILNILAGFTEEILKADRCTVFLLDRKTNELYSWVAHGMGTIKIRFSADKGLAGDAVRTGRAINVTDAYEDSRFNREVDKQTGYRTKSLLCIPMENQMGEIIGIFEVMNKKNNKVFDSRDEEILVLLARQAASSIESATLYEELKKSFTSFIDTLAEAIDARDPSTAGHSHRVCGYATMMAANMNYDKDSLSVLKYASLLHDVGKIGVRESVLTKPGSLTEDEFNHMKTHAVITRKILEKTYFSPRYRDIPAVASSHHEKIDGTGYPDELNGDDIPELAKIMAVADVFDALTFRRHYRKPMPIDQVVEEIEILRSSKFDSDCVDALMNLKIHDILKVMSSTAHSEEPDVPGDKLKDLTLKQIAIALKEKKGDSAVNEFMNIYQAMIDEKNG